MPCNLCSPRCLPTTGGKSSSHKPGALIKNGIDAPSNLSELRCIDNGERTTSCSVLAYVRLASWTLQVTLVHWLATTRRYPNPQYCTECHTAFSGSSIRTREVGQTAHDCSRRHDIHRRQGRLSAIQAPSSPVKYSHQPGVCSIDRPFQKAVRQ